MPGILYNIYENRVYFCDRLSVTKRLKYKELFGILVLAAALVFREMIIIETL